VPAAARGKNRIGNGKAKEIAEDLSSYKEKKEKKEEEEEEEQAEEDRGAGRETSCSQGTSSR